MKKTYKIFFVIALIAFLFTVIIDIVIYKGISESFDESKKPSLAEIEGTESSTLWFVDRYYDEDIGNYVEISNADATDEYIAFVMSKDTTDVEYGAGSYYPIAYWKGEYETMDLAENEFQYHEYKLHGSDDSNVTPVNDVSEIIPDKLYFSDIDSWNGYTEGKSIIERYERYKEVKVYDESAYLGFERNEFNKGQIRLIGRGFAFVACLGVSVVGIVISCLFLTIGFVTKRRYNESINNVN